MLCVFQISLESSTPTPVLDHVDTSNCSSSHPLIHTYLVDTDGGSLSFTFTRASPASHYSVKVRVGGVPSDITTDAWFDLGDVLEVKEDRLGVVTLYDGVGFTLMVPGSKLILAGPTDVVVAVTCVTDTGRENSIIHF